MILETVFTALAVWSGSLQTAPAPQYHRPRAAKHAPTRVVRAPAHVPLPKPRPVIAAQPASAPPVAAAPADDAPYPFVWRAPYDLPPKWVQIWQFVA